MQQVLVSYYFPSQGLACEIIILLMQNMHQNMAGAVHPRL